MNRYSFANRTAIITGAAGGIGASLATQIAERGSSLALVDRDLDGLNVVAESITRRHPWLRVSLHQADFSVPEEFDDLGAEIRDRHDQIGLLINNAGVALGGQVDDVSMQDLDWIMNINFRAPVALTKQFLPDLHANPGAHVVNVSSLFGLIAPAGQAFYSASKFAIRGFTLALQAELIPAGVGVTVVHPGGIATNIAKNARIGSEHGSDPEAAEESRDEIQRLLTMTPQDAARRIVDTIERRGERLVLTRRAKFADLVARALPVRQRTIIARDLEG